MNTDVLYKYVCLGLLGIVSFSFFKNLIYYFSGVYDIDSHNNRLKQLDYSSDRLKKNTENESNIKQTRELIEKITEPIIKHVMPNIAYKKDLSELEKGLHFAGVDKYMTTSQYISLILLGRVVGAVLLILLFPFNQMLACLWFAGPALLPSFLLKNTVNEKKGKILLGFPEFINISKSYLVSGMSFEKSVEESIYYVNKEWQSLLKQYLINSESYSKKECLTMLAEESYSFEVKEFISIVKLNMEQGIDIKDSFDSQYEKIKDLQKIAIQKKIESRRVWAVFVQAPVLLTIFLAFGLPMVDSMTSFTNGL